MIFRYIRIFEKLLNYYKKINIIISIKIELKKEFLEIIIW